MPEERGREVVIVEAARTPIGRGHPEKGYYKDTHPNALLGKCYTEAIERAGIPAEEVEDVIAGCVQQYGEQMFNVARNAWLQAGLPVETPATTVDRQCGSAQQAVNFAAALIAAGVHDVVIGSGVEHMGHVPMGIGFNWVDEVGSPWPPELMQRYNLIPQGLSAEMIADKWEIPRSELDELALRSHQLADGAAAVLLMAREKAETLGLTPRARILDQTTVGVDPVIMLTGPIPATQRLLERNGMTIDDIDLIEINEAFAPVVAAWRREL